MIGPDRVMSRSTVQELDYSAPSFKSVGNTTTVISAADPNRRYLAIVNDSSEVIYLAVDADAVMNRGIRLNANGGVFEMTGLHLSLQVVNGICASGGMNVTLQEATL